MFDGMATEMRNPATMDIDRRSIREALTVINDQDKTVPIAVEQALDSIAGLVEDAVSALSLGGRLIYIGAGTSGRLGVLDASECPPTFNADPEMVQGLIAGGKEALVSSIEGAEDDREAGARELKALEFSKKDILLGITASGQAPYVMGALEYAHSLKAVTGAISCNAGSATFDLADHKILLAVGPEVIAGSTRMKAGTAQKLTLNMISTTVMIRLGKVYRNLMVDMRPVNKKLIQRSLMMICELTECTPSEAEKVFEDSGRNLRCAVLMRLLGLSRREAEEELARNGNVISRAIESQKQK